MSCLYRSDYGPPQPGFDPLANSALIAGHENHRAQLATAQNQGQLEAMLRAYDHNQKVQWCTPGYGWTYDPALTLFFGTILVVFVIPYFIMRFFPKLRSRLPRRNIHTFD